MKKESNTVISQSRRYHTKKIKKIRIEGGERVYNSLATLFYPFFKEIDIVIRNWMSRYEADLLLPKKVKRESE